MTSPRPHPDLQPLLTKHGLTWAEFSKQGRPPKGVREKRSHIVTELHQSGRSWQEMVEVTGLSLMGIQRLTRGVGCEAARRNRAANAARVGAAGKGREKPEVSRRMKRAWREGQFDFHRGRKRTEAELETLQEANSRPEVRAKRAASAHRRWQDPEQREKLVSFHRSEEQRQSRSSAQSLRMIENPEKWTRGRGAYVQAAKCTRGRFWTRSSFERGAVAKVEADPEVVSFEFEPRLLLSNGRWIIPDLLLTLVGGARVLIEVKASWVLSLPATHRVSKRLAVARAYASQQGWAFFVWTEKDFGEWLTAEKS